MQPLAGIWRIVVHVKAIEDDDLPPAGVKLFLVLDGIDHCSLASHSDDPIAFLPKQFPAGKPKENNLPSFTDNHSIHGNILALTLR